MALAGPAEALMTATVHDLVVGDDVASALVAETPLKGVPGTWTQYRILAVDGVAVPEPLDADEAIERLVAAPGGRHPSAVRRLAVGLATVGALILFGGWAWL